MSGVSSGTKSSKGRLASCRDGDMQNPRTFFQPSFSVLPGRAAKPPTHVTRMAFGNVRSNADRISSVALVRHVGLLTIQEANDDKANDVVSAPATIRPFVVASTPSNVSFYIIFRSCNEKPVQNSCATRGLDYRIRLHLSLGGLQIINEPPVIASSDT